MTYNSMNHGLMKMPKIIRTKYAEWENIPVEEYVLSATEEAAGLVQASLKIKLRLN